jgi:hypothetical protein
MNSLNQAIDQTLSHYIACALWSSTEEDGSPLDRFFSADDISPDAIAQMRSECRDFIRHSLPLLREYPQGCEQLGHDFWLTRNGHGAGFWDRGLGDLGDKLSAAAKTFGSSDLYVGDDGLLYVS